MAEPFAAVLARARRWFEQGVAAEWLTPEDLALLDGVEQGSPAALFAAAEARPLVVALFGGTGVGKSSLLNRLAGAAIARTGVERPTSREVTVYVHESVALAALPPALPLDAVRVERHAQASQRNILWIDAPDIDSTEEANRRAALAWLPHVDLVCYVVSPERYRDDAGWRVLRGRGQRHGWLFLMNRWDEGDARQTDDFARLLREAGFAQPLILHTSCAPGRPLPTPDEFDQLAALLQEILAAHGLKELARLGQQARWRELREVLASVAPRFGAPDAWERLSLVAGEHWAQVSETVRAGAEWSLRAAAARFSASEPGWWRPVARGWRAARGAAVESAESPPSDPTAPLDALVDGLWDDWSASKLGGWGDAVELAARRGALPAGPLRRRVDAELDAAGATARAALRDAVRTALARPGDRLTRMLRRGTGFLAAFLPLLALLWIAYRVLEGFYYAGRGRPYLGVEFAVNSALVLLIAWGVPYTCDRLLRPSLERTVLRALRSGLDAALDELGARLATAVEETAAAARAAAARHQELCAAVEAALLPPEGRVDPRVARLVAATP